MRTPTALLLFALATPCVAQDKAQSVQDPALRKAIHEAIERGVAFLKESQEKSGSWSYTPGRKGQYEAGMTALCVYALAASGVPSDDPAIRRGVAWMFEHGSGYARGASHATYAASLLVLALARIDADKHKDAIRQLAARIAAGQNGGGTWTYRLDGGRGADLSNTQFAIMALWTARTKADARIDAKVWERVHRCLVGSQSKHGWSYGFDGRYPTPSMTAAGLFGLVVSEAALDGGRDALKKARESKRARAGAELLMKKPLPYPNYYFCYGLERAATVMGLPPAEWYVDGAKHLVEAQSPDGSWGAFPGAAGRHGTGASNYNTSLALLFLARATGFILTPRDQAGPITARDAKFPDAVTPKNLKRAFEAYLLADEESRKQWTPRFGAAGPAAVALFIDRLGDPEAPIRAAARDLLGALLEKRLLFDPDADETDREIMLAAIRNWFDREGAALRWDENTGRFRGDRTGAR